MTEAIDWDHAVRRGGALAKAGPPADLVGLRELVASLRSSAEDAPAYVADVTGLTEAAARATEAQVLVVDRPRWSAAAAETFRAMAGEQLPASRLPGAARLAGEQLGWVLALLSTRILGQFDPYSAGSGAHPGRLLLVAPNVLAVQRQLDADAEDFHLWVCLHEQTHAVQFAAAPWLADHLRSALQEVLRAQLGDEEDDEATHDGAATDDDAATDDGAALASDRLASGERAPVAPADPDDLDPDLLDPDDLDLSDAPDAPAPAPGDSVVQRVIAGLRGTGAVPGLLEAVLPPEQREVLNQTVATMSLLEGHADVVMDEVGPRAIPSVKAIRSGFEKRRDERTLSSIVLRRLLGLDAKLLQYRNGAEFVRTVRSAVGHEGLNAVWAGPELLPTPAEIAEPALWVARVHG